MDCPIIVEYRGCEIAAARRGRRWHVEFRGVSATGLFLNDALSRLISDADDVILLTLAILEAEASAAG